MNETAFTTCAYCPRLCRHVCPVAVATGREAATASALMTAPLLHASGTFSTADALAGTSLCLGCGACTAHCKLHVPVPERLAAWRAPHLPPPRPAPLAPIAGDAPHVCVLTDEADWSAAWSRTADSAAATLRTPDELGHAAWRAGASDVPAALARHLAGRTVVTASGAVAAVAVAAGLPVLRLAAPPAELTFVCCFDGPAPSPDQLACCGRREDFPAREPDAARAVADENVRRFAGRTVACADAGCASWLRAHGARVVSPTDPPAEVSDGR